MDYQNLRNIGESTEELIWLLIEKASKLNNEELRELIAEIDSYPDQEAQ